MRVVLAVSGTLQEGFPLRKNLDAPGAPAVHLGSGLVRCVKSYLDTKEPGCREHGNDPNPCCVVTGDEADANVYELYLVDGEACVAYGDHYEKGGRAEGFHQVGGCEGRGDGACREPEHEGGGELDTFF